jgi:IS30 family transposase
MRTLTQYEVAWNMHQAGSAIEQITVVVGKHRATVYRWLAKIKRIGIREFLRRKATCKQRRPHARTPEHVIQRIVDIRNQYGWCGQKIRKELKERHGLLLGLSTIYRWLHARFTGAAVGIRRYKKHQALVTASAPRQVIEHDTVDLGGLYAYTAIDIFSKEPSVYIGTDLHMRTGAEALAYHGQYYGFVQLQQSDNGSEFQTTFREAVLATGSLHRYSRPYKKNEQAHIENFNRALRNECFGDVQYAPAEIEAVRLQAKLFIQHYIHERWHMGLPDMMTPSGFAAWYRHDPQAATLAVAKVTGKSRLG